ncbi:TetR family transcriptional regulator [Glaciibacter flavus]|uniref:TetR family transcriptional regulator n=1 Tax=Orlajensenia flava TaxID=2565934 RepID=A0A4S4FMF5_9MICO|nr:TetR/AcrR family transcriptional regulator [Glaciibacter flavus]THG30446.1 TetR family transcriptional regulator [Glaciibacter flavus]THG30630.1 TetR family transcriptional regulator [Glaciibacter flavus]
MSEEVGRRERKKAATRASILDAALTLFFERGFDGASVREIADLADVTPKTVFAHFPRKEALVFSDEDDRHETLLRAVTARASGTSISDALAAHYLAELAAMQTDPQRRVLALMHDTPSLVEYAEKMWLLHEGALADAIAQELGLSEPTIQVRFFAHFALQIQLHASRAQRPEVTIRAGFELLEPGWDSYCSTLRDPAK